MLPRIVERVYREQCVIRLVEIVSDLSQLPWHGSAFHTVACVSLGAMKAYNSDITVEEFIARHTKPCDPVTDNYFREPFAYDISEGKSWALFPAHAYHAKLLVGAIIPGFSVSLLGGATTQ